MRRSSLKLRTDYWHQEGRYARPQRVQVLTLARLVNAAHASDARGGRLAKRPVKLGNGRTVYAYACPPPEGHTAPVDSVLVAPVDDLGRVNLAAAHLARVASLIGPWAAVEADTRAAQAKARAEAEARRASETQARARRASLLIRLRALGVEVPKAEPWTPAGAGVTLGLDELEAVLDVAQPDWHANVADAADRRMMRATSA